LDGAPAVLVTSDGFIKDFIQPEEGINPSGCVVGVPVSKNQV
jgi:hypothetical protein